MAKGKTRATVRITWVKDLCGTKIVEQRTQGVLSDTCHPLHDGERKLFAGDCADLQHLSSLAVKQWMRAPITASRVAGNAGGCQPVGPR